MVHQHHRCALPPMFWMDVQHRNEALFKERIFQHGVTDHAAMGFDNRAVACANGALNENAALRVLLSDMVKLTDGVDISFCGSAN